MVPTANLGAFVLASLVLICIPGPAVLFVVGRSLALGRVGGLLSGVGNFLGTLPLVAAVSLGLGAVIAQSAAAFLLLKLGGAAYLVYLGVQAIRHRHDTAQTVTAGPRRRSPSRLLLEGMVVGVTNPKTIAFFVAVLPQFVSLEAGSVAVQLAVLGTIFVLIGMACDAVWALAAGSARAWFGRSPRRLSRMSATGGVMMIGLGGALAVSGSKS